MAFELPDDPRTSRRARARRWVSVGLVAVLVALVAYLGYVGYAGSEQAVDPPAPSRDCRTPEIAYGWAYEPINYSRQADRAFAALPDPTDCDIAPAEAGEELVTSDGVRLVGWYIPAASGIGPEGPTIVVAHGHGGNKSGMLGHAALLHGTFNLVLFDFRGHGQSQRAPSTVGLLERLDLRAVIDWLEASKAPGAIGVLGISMGGSAAVNEAIGDLQVRALALDSTHATVANAIQARLERRGYPLGLPGAWAIMFGGLIRTGQDMSAADPVQAAARYGERPMLVIAAGQDDALGGNDAREISAAAEEGGSAVELETCAAAGHGQSIDACPDDYASWVLGFFERTLGSS